MDSPPGNDQNPGADGWNVDEFLAGPLKYFDFSLTDIMRMSPSEISELQISGLKRRFEHFRGQLPMLDKLADAQRIDTVSDINDVVPLLFDNAIYKSYPSSLLDRRNYGAMTRWLSKLTTVDLSHVDVSGCTSLDEWIIALEQQAGIALVHTSGTSGTMSFLPWTVDDWNNVGETFAVHYFQTFDGDGAQARMPIDIDCIFPYFRSGALVHIRLNDPVEQRIAGSKDRFHVAFPGRLSSDLMLLATRYRAAAAEGRIDQLVVDDEMDKRREEFERQQRAMPGEMEAFFQNMKETLAGKRIFMVATTSLFFKLAESGLAQGLKNLFSRDSVIVTGGGGKGLNLPDNWIDITKEFFGVDRIFVNYGMSELSTNYVSCVEGNYHTFPWVIPFILDPVSAVPLPRTGEVTGRFAFYDLIPQTRWGGFVTNDEVTMNWDQPCACGQGTGYISGTIERYSNKAGFTGEDKLSCAATPAAYAEALDFLNQDAR